VKSLVLSTNELIYSGGWTPCLSGQSKSREIHRGSNEGANETNAERERWKRGKKMPVDQIALSMIRDRYLFDRRVERSLGEFSRQEFPREDPAWILAQVHPASGGAALAPRVGLQPRPAWTGGSVGEA